MTANNSKANGGARRSAKFIGVAVLVVVAAVVVIWLKAVRGNEDPMAMMATFVAKRGSLTISVLESGAIKAKEQEIIRNEVEGRTTIVEIIAEGTRVKKGDLLLKLDASTMDDDLIDQEIRVKNADAASVNAEEALAIAKNQAKSDVELAELTLQFAKQDMDVYTEGQYPNLVTAAEAKVQEANEVLTRAIQTRDWSETLFKEKYLSETELLADRLAVTKGKNSLIVAQKDLELLEKYTRQREVDKLVSDVNQAEMALERTRRKASANLIQAEAERDAKEQELKRQQMKLDKIRTQIAKATVYSPTDGMVVYATSSRGGFGRQDRQPLADGVEVWERQELIYIPKSSSSVAEVDVHEASLDKVRAGLPAIVTVDALPGKKFVGTVDRIAPLPNAQSMWMNPDLKVYTTNINLETLDEGLRSGMSCKAEIIVEQYKDVAYVPLQAVLRVGGQPTVFVVKDGEIQERKVQIGLDNNSMIAVLSGLEEGEVVLMTPPLKAAELEPGERLGSGDANDVTSRRISEKLKAANEQPSPPSGTPGQDVQAPAGAPGQPGVPAAGQGLQMPTAEQIREFQNKTPEERQKMMEERMKNMTPEQRQQFEQMRQQRRSTPGQGGGEGGQGGGRRGQAGGGQPQGGQ